jgi:hypothetical protein
MDYIAKSYKKNFTAKIAIFLRGGGVTNLSGVLTHFR